MFLLDHITRQQFKIAQGQHPKQKQFIQEIRSNTYWKQVQQEGYGAAWSTRRQMGCIIKGKLPEGNLRAIRLQFMFIKI